MHAELSSMIDRIAKLEKDRNIYINNGKSDGKEVPMAVGDSCKNAVALSDALEEVEELAEKESWTEVASPRSSSPHRSISIKNHAEVDGETCAVEEELLEDDFMGEEKIADAVMKDGGEFMGNINGNVEEEKDKSTARPSNTNNKSIKRSSKKNKKKRNRRHRRRRIKQSAAVSTFSKSAAVSTVPSSSAQSKYFGLIGKVMHSVVSVLLMRGGKRFYMIGAFITACWLRGGMNDNDFFTNKSISEESSGSVRGGFSFFQGVRALQDCPEQYLAANADAYEIATKVTAEEKVYECTEYPCGWRIIGTCTGNIFLPSSTSQPTTQTLGVSLHYPSMMPSTTMLNNGYGEERKSNGEETDDTTTDQSFGRIGSHITDNQARQGVVGEDETEQSLFYPDYILSKCVDNPSSAYTSNQASITVEDCCETW